jgi:hypothetical protein
MKKTNTLALIGFFLFVAYFSIATLAGAAEYSKTPEIHYPATGEALKVFDTLNVGDTFIHRGPASAGKRKAKAQRAVSNLPKTVKSGFEVRVHYKGVSQTYWIMDQGGNFNFSYANSAGSRAAPPITSEDFAALYKSAESVPPASPSIIAKCPATNIMVFVREPDKQDRVSAGCAEGKDKASRQLQVLTNWLMSRL